MPENKLEKRADCKSSTTPACIEKLYNIKPFKGDKSPVRFGVAGFLEEYANYQDLFDFINTRATNLKGQHANFSVELVNGGKNLQDANRAGAEANLAALKLACGQPFIMEGKIDDGESCS